MEGIKDAQRKLYSWRMDFFLDKFKSVYLEDPISTWTTDGFDDNHCLDTIPMQITLNFDEVWRRHTNYHALFCLKNYWTKRDERF